MSADLQIQVRDLQARCAKLEALAEEVWGVLITAALMEKTTHPDIRTALMRVERRLRAAGLKRFPPTVAEGGDRNG